MLKRAVFKRPSQGAPQGSSSDDKDRKKDESSQRKKVDPLGASIPIWAQFPSTNFVIGAGVAIFHLKTQRVVIVYHPVDDYHFLPKGRRDVNEVTHVGAEREGYEESGYRNRVLPLPIKHRQPQPRIPPDPRIREYNTEPVWTLLMPQTAHSQYLLHWYVAETVPPDVEEAMTKEEEQGGISFFGGKGVYKPPLAFGVEDTLQERLAREPDGYVPVKHEGTSADEDEALYQSRLVSVEEAVALLNPVEGDVVRRGLAAILARARMEGVELGA